VGVREKPGISPTFLLLLLLLWVVPMEAAAFPASQPSCDSLFIDSLQNFVSAGGRVTISVTHLKGNKNV